MNAREGALKRDVMGDAAHRSKPILLVDSSFKSTVTISRIFRELELLDDLVIAVDCENALMRLNQVDPIRPMMILLDLTMPRMSALGFLRLLKEDTRFQTIPVVVLAESSDPDDVATCYNLGAAGYLVKPSDYDELHTKLKSVCDYWTLSRLPRTY